MYQIKSEKCTLKCFRIIVLSKTREKVKYAIGKWDKAFITLHTENIFSLLQNLEGENTGNNKVS